MANYRLRIGFPNSYQLTAVSGSYSLIGQNEILSYSSSGVGPSLFYTDIVDGPTVGGENNNGAYVTLYGKNFEAARGTGSVTLAGQAVAAYKFWSDTKIIVQLGISVNTGNFTVTTNSGKSVTGCISKPNGSPNDFTVRTGSIIFVSTTGTGDGSFANPYGPSQWSANLNSGTIAYFRGGTYSSPMGPQTTFGGRQVDFYSASSGTLNNRTALAPYPGETVNFTTTRSTVFYPGDSINRCDYLTIAGFNLQATTTLVDSQTNVNVPESGNVGIRVVGNDLVAPVMGSFTGMVVLAGDDCQVLGNTFHDSGSGSNNDHAVYAQGGGDNYEIAWNTFYNLNMGFVIQNHQDQLMTYTGYRCHDNEIYKGTTGNCRAIVCSGRNGDSDGEIYNNIIGPGVGQAFGAIVIYSGSVNIYNNTIYNPDGAGIYVDNTFYAVTNVRARNNIIVCASGTPYISVGGTVTLGGALFTASNNLYFGNGAGPAADTAGINADPQLVNTATRDFRIQSTSPARNSGTATMYSALDHNGVSRPQGASVCVGAYEFV